MGTNQVSPQCARRLRAFVAALALVPLVASAQQPNNIEACIEYNAKQGNTDFWCLDWFFKGGDALPGEIETFRKAVANAKAERERAELERRTAVTKQLREARAQQAAQARRALAEEKRALELLESRARIRIGMPREEVLRLWQEKPLDIYTTSTSRGTEEQADMGGGFYLYFRNGKLYEVQRFP